MQKTKYEELCNLCRETIARKVEAIEKAESILGILLADGLQCHKECITFSFESGNVEDGAIKGQFTIELKLNTLAQSESVFVKDMEYEYSYSGGAPKILIFCCEAGEPFEIGKSDDRLIDAIFKELKKNFI